MSELSGREKDLLHWLGQEDFSQYGECHGATLDSLIKKGLARVHASGERQQGFIAKGDGLMYRAVSLTETGAAIAKAEGRHA